MSRSKHPRGFSKRASAYRRKAKTWKGDSTWKPSERIVVEDSERRSSRVRSGDNLIIVGWPRP